MATFPALTPSTRTYTPGAYAHTIAQTLDGDTRSVRHSNGEIGNRLRMGFVDMTRAEHFSLVSHFALHGTFATFDLAAATIVAAGITVPFGYLWRYAASPEIEEICGRIDVTIDLELLPPYLI